MRIDLIKTTEYIDKAWNLLEMHREELATYKHLMVLKPDMGRYQALEDAGKLIGIGLFDDKDELIGYSIFIITTALHYSDLTIAQNDLLYVHPDYRKTKWGLQLIKYSEFVMKDHAQMILWHGKEGTKFSELMPKLGYIIQDIMFSKEL